MRLIDADKLIEHLKAAYNHEKDVINSYWLLNTLIDKVDEVPTDYNVDKVVEQLETEQQKYVAQALETDDIDTVFRCAINEVNMQTAIGIVKRGGKEQ